MNVQLAETVKRHWQELRGRTYDLLDELTEADLDKRLPFPTAQSIGYQFSCMLGTQESWPPVLTTGQMAGWSCSLASVPKEEISRRLIREHMQRADEQLLDTLVQVDWARTFADGSTPLAGYLRLVEHESHHQGQLINLIYANHLPIPVSWADAWALTRED